MATHPLQTDGRREYLFAYGLTTASGPLALASLVALSVAVSNPKATDTLSVCFLALFIAAMGALALGRFLRRRAWQWVAGFEHLADPAWMRRLALAVDIAGVIALPALLLGTGADLGVRLVLGATLFMGCGFIASRRITTWVPWVTRFMSTAVAASVLLPTAEMPLSQTIQVACSMTLLGAVVALIFRLLRGRVAPFLG